MKIQYLGVSGKLRHGKDTLAELIMKKSAEKFGGKYGDHLSCTKIAFADPIKKMAKIMVPSLTDEDLWGPSQNRARELQGYVNPDTGEVLRVRDILTHIGQWGRGTNPDCWINAAFGLADDFVKEFNPATGTLWAEYVLIVFSDCRFRNEKRAIESKDGPVIRIVRPSVGFTTNHPSEVDLDGEDVVFTKKIINENMSDLEKAAEDVVQDLFK